MLDKKLVIVGGGYVGIELAKALEYIMNVTLIEPREVFVHAPAMIRALVEPSILESALMPYDKLLSRGLIIQDRVTSIEDAGVTLSGGDRLDADYIVVATGSWNGIVFKPKGSDIEAFRAAHREIHKKLQAANTVAIIGAGAVGTELAGEVAYAMPDKKVILISSQASLFPDLPPKLGVLLAKKLRSSGVTLILNARAENLQSLVRPYAGQVTLSNGQSIEADLIIPAVGSQAKTDLLQLLPGARNGSRNRIVVDSYLRPSDYPNVFAAGDVADAGDSMTIVAASRQQPWLAKTLKALAQGKKLDSLSPYSPWKKAPIFIPLGPEKGNSYLMIATFGDWVTRQMKGRDLFISKYRKILGLS